MCAQKPALAIIVCTFKRPDLLRATLKSIAAQQSMVCAERVQVYVVDNSDEGDARGIVAEQAATSPWPMTWLEAHPANISVARNAGVKAGQEEFVAFVDDDQILHPGWLDAVARLFSHKEGDAWLGCVHGVFETPERTTPAIRSLFGRELQEPFGYELFAFGSGKLPSVNPATNNSIFRRAALDSDAPFDPAYGKGGGEDYDLFCRLQRRGKRLFWAPDVVVSEFVPASRCDRGYLRRRFFAGGQVFAAAIAGSASRPGLARWLIRLKALVQGALLLAGGPKACFAGEARRADYLFRWAGVLGKLSFGEIYPLYQPKK
ncbi:succinoglycan biosynthesis protein ExoM [Rhodoblastus sphagnicola]|nr:glycosyltransferase family 2 protein [Rhodoblastus sphagnicola]MBB4198688.1 succinoglycan biosynthesis protein ExoM [Rhodoblastus sphagnicola]